LEESAQDIKVGRVSDTGALIQGCADGEASAMMALYDETSRLVFGLALRILQDAAQAEEVLLDIYTQVWKEAATCDAKRIAPLVWLMRITRARAIDRLRAGKQEQRREDTPEPPARFPRTGDEAATVRPEQQRLVFSAMQLLMPEQRHVIEMAYYSGMSQSEIAAAVGQPLGMIRIRARQGMIKLSDLLRPLLDARA
jgi:RNA polymerase sigma-70 factor, ECF subfamily